MQNKKRISAAMPVVRLANRSKAIGDTPTYLTPMQFSRYPPDNAITFERWYYNNWNRQDERERVYLPIQWTALYCNNGYGNAPILHTIQKYLDGLDRSKKYYTIVQYDDGILNNIEHLDIKVIAMAGPRIDFAIPMLCTPHKFNFGTNIKKDIFASFIGSYTHAIRAQMVDQLKDKEGYYISTKHHDLKEYCQILARSKYALCPRGYGQSSFRIQEAIDFGAIPVYISDEFVLPYNMPTFVFGITIPVGEDGNTNIVDVLGYAEETGLDKIGKIIIEKNKSLFTYAGCKKEILNHLANEQKNNEGGDTKL